MADRKVEKIVAFSSVVVLVIFNTLFKRYGREIFGVGNIYAGLADLLATLISLGLPILVIHFFTRKSEKVLPYDDFSVRELLGSILFVLGLGFLFRICYAYIASFLSFIQPENLKGKGFLVICIYFVSSVVLPSVLEEILFREKLYNIFERQGLPVLTTVLLFAFSHSGIHSIINAFVFGFLLQFIYLNSRRLGYCIIIHFLNNSIAFLAVTAEDGSILQHVANTIPYIFASCFIIFAIAVFIGRKKKHEQ